jgi:processive 1,2-diacylglycerol beta-glucosyltransferase
VIWILTAGFGDGHNAAARAVAEAWAVKHPETPVLAEDWLLRQLPVLSRLSMEAYRHVIVQFPSLWRMGFERLAEHPEEGLHPALLALLRGPLEADLERLKPQVIVSTYPLYSSLLEKLRESGVPVPPLLTVITDAMSIHPTWVFAPSERYAVIEQESLAALMKLGVPAEKVCITGFPVRLDYMRPLEPSDEPKGGVLYLPSTPVAHVETTLRELEKRLPAATRLTVVMGRHEQRLYHRMTHFADQCRALQLKVHGWTDCVPTLLRQHDLVITKAGGAIVHEAMAAAVPTILDCVVPGQEEGNARELEQAGGGIVTHSPQETASVAASWLTSEPGELEKMRAALLAVSKTDAALRVVSEVERLAEAAQGH